VSTLSIVCLTHTPSSCIVAEPVPHIYFTAAFCSMPV
jgi:hypothetical protein